MPARSSTGVSARACDADNSTKRAVASRGGGHLRASEAGAFARRSGSAPETGTPERGRREHGERRNDPPDALARAGHYQDGGGPGRREVEGGDGFGGERREKDPVEAEQLDQPRGDGEIEHVVERRGEALAEQRRDRDLYRV